MIMSRIIIIIIIIINYLPWVWISFASTWASEAAVDCCWVSDIAFV